MLITFLLFATLVCHCHMWYCHGNSCIQMLISSETKSTSSYTQYLKLGVLMLTVCALETDYNIINLCDNKNVKFHCFNPRKTQPLGISPLLFIVHG